MKDEECQENISLSQPIGDLTVHTPVPAAFGLLNHSFADLHRAYMTNMAIFIPNHVDIYPDKSLFIRVASAMTLTLIALASAPHEPTSQSSKPFKQ